MSASDTAGGPAGRKQGPRVLKTGKDAQNGHYNTLATLGETIILTHPGCRLVLCMQSAYSKDILIHRTHNMGGHAAKLKQMFKDVCADMSGRVPTAVLCAELRSQLAELADELVIAKITEVLVELFLVAKIVGDKQATMMINCAAGVDLDEAGKHGQAGQG